MKNGLKYIAILFIIGLLGSCSVNKNTRMNRFYHAFNSRYNIYYNGKTSFDEAFYTLNHNYKENYTQQIELFPISAQPKEKTELGGPFDRAIEKGEKAIKIHSITKKPKKKRGWRNDPKQVALQAKEEYNPFLRKCWLLIGEGQFYNADFLQASATFSYIARHYADDEEMVAQAKLWQARCYNEMGWRYESEDILQKLNKNGIPSKQLNLYATVEADFLIKTNQIEDAIPYLEKAIRAEKDGLQRKRMTYLLGQLYQRIGFNGFAYKTYKKVIRSNPPYDLEFASRIRLTEVLDGDNEDKVIKILKKLVHNRKNKNYLDQIYYALGNVYINKQDTLSAIKNYKLGIEKTTQHGLDMAICAITLGDLYFKQQDYIHAQPCFSSALSAINEDFKDYKRIAKLSKVLDELVVHAEAKHLQDSLQLVAKMPESERLALIDKKIEQVKKEEQELKNQADREAFLADQAAQGSGINRPETGTKTITLPTTSGGKFYFYNPQTVAQGKTQFQQKWGRRILEDNWRRREKQMTTFNINDNNSTSEDELNKVEKTNTDSLSLPDSLTNDPHQRAFYLQQLPLTPEDIDASNLIIQDALFNMAMIYKDKLENLEMAVNAFKELEEKYPNNKYSLESFYQTYLLALRTINKELANETKEKLIKAFPESDYALAISNPNYEYNMRHMDAAQDSIYQETYKAYIENDTASVRNNYNIISNKYPLATLMPKFMFLNALSYVQSGNALRFKISLKELLDKYPKAEVSDLAKKMLKGVLQGKIMQKGNTNSIDWNLRLGDNLLLTAADSNRVFSKEENTLYRLVFAYPNGSINDNKILYAIATYNFSNFIVKQFDMDIKEMGAMKFFELKSFVNLDAALYYYQMIYKPNGFASIFEDRVAIFPISDDNYELLIHGKTLNEYLTFIDTTYTEKIKDVVTRCQHVEKKYNNPKYLNKIKQNNKTIKEKKIIKTNSIPEKSNVINIEKPHKELTLDDIKAIRQKESIERAEKKTTVHQEFKKEQLKKAEMQQQILNQNKNLLEKQKEVENTLLEAKEKEEKKLEIDHKKRLQQKEKERKAKLKAQAKLRKEKERAYKERLKQKEKEQKEKRKAYEKRRKEKERAYKERLKQKEKSNKN